MMELTDKYRGKLGMFEMEAAVEAIEKEAELNHISLKDFKIPVPEFLSKFSNIKEHETTDDSYILTGFCQLLYRGWLIPDIYNSIFSLHKDLLERMDSEDLSKYSTEDLKRELESRNG